MRLRNWIAVVVGVVLLAAAGAIGFWVNHSALQAADDVHKADSRALAVNNGTLVGQLQLLSAGELGDFLGQTTLHLGRGNAQDRAALTAFASKSGTFSYGALLVTLDGQVLTSSRSTGVPAAGNTGWQPLFTMLKSGQKAGFSSIMAVDGVYLEAVGVPVVVGGSAAAIMIGLNNVATTSLQQYTVTLSSSVHLTAVADSTGTIAASNQEKLLGTQIDPAVRNAIANTQDEFVEYTTVAGTPMIAIVVRGLPGGWSYARIQTKKSFDGAVHTKSQTLNMTLGAMLLIGVLAMGVLGYRTQIQRRRADERFQALFQHAPDMVSVLDGDGNIEYSSPSAAAVLGFSEGVLVGTSVFDIVHPEHRDYMREQFALLIARSDAVLRLQCLVRGGNGQYRWFEFTASNQMHNPSLHGVVINARDISENKAAQEQLKHEAGHDALTGLPNRRRMQDALGTSLRNQPVAVLFVDLDGFKPVNDVHGHEAGDELLRQVAGRLSSCVREWDVLARVGGDEFVILMPGVLSSDDASGMSDRIRHALAQPFTIGGHQVQIGASVGVHLAAGASDPDAALRAADHAMYAMKHARPASSQERVGRHRAAD
ncbi:sensor domain-containing diguanylate cyclase [Actinoplanes bogorensis]|uniref:Sensor domain-containing diguanylate cyclase n=1 Tax=Paractinoplanes bogorensis TaxID=1610840 RepID=A0ABS5YKM6_9ACTN|nr:sensor domain-containing diguanylate cyclase [Actinoplanes bogorensis]MBU2662505.1 sensor domain-containing diguanylate cyclase [Actinoplanes bogorensis]